MNKQRTFQHALHEWIAGVSDRARASDRVVHHFAFSIVAAGSWAGILTLHVNTGLFRGAVGIDKTLRSTGRWCADICGQT